MREWQKWPINRLNQEDFPSQLKNIQKPPKTLFYRGNWDENIFKNTIAVVGSRKMTPYGKEVVSELIPGLVEAGLTVISGFMYGVDTEAHRQCLLHKGKTVAVVGGGLDILAPLNNDDLYTEILLSGGMVISEYPAEFHPTVWSFPQRDRIMTGLSTIGVLVVEGGVKSGSMISAKYAMKQFRPVMAVPGPINSKVSVGTNWLIKSGAAKMITNLEDIISDFHKSPTQTSLFKDYADLSDTERRIIDVLERESVTIDELSNKVYRPKIEVSRAISVMLVRDLVEEKNGKVYLS